MADRVDRATRSRIMSSIRGDSTGPERAARTIARLSGVRFRTNARDLPGSPDIVFDRERVAVFVHGCFWHRHEGCPRGRRTPRTNAAFWRAKFRANVARDQAALARLRDLGWTVEVIWECQL